MSKKIDLSAFPVTTMDPNDVVLVTESGHPLYQARVHKPVNQALVNAMKTNGFNSTVILVKGIDPTAEFETGDVTEKLLVVAGRGRVKAAREAGIAINAVILNPDEYSWSELMAIMDQENVLRDDYNVLEKARAAQAIINQYIEEKRPEDVSTEDYKPNSTVRKEAHQYAADSLGYTPGRLTNLLRLLDPTKTADEVIQAIEDGKIEAKAALNLTSGSSIADQKRLVTSDGFQRLFEKRKAEGSTSGKKAGKKSTVTASDIDELKKQDRKARSNSADTEATHVQVPIATLRKITLKKNTPPDVVAFIKALLADPELSYLNSDLPYLPGASLKGGKG